MRDVNCNIFFFSLKACCVTKISFICNSLGYGHLRWTSKSTDRTVGTSPRSPVWGEATHVQLLYISPTKGSQLLLSLRIDLSQWEAACPRGLGLSPQSLDSLKPRTNGFRVQKADPFASSWNQVCGAMYAPEISLGLGWAWTPEGPTFLAGSLVLPATSSPLHISPKSTLNQLCVLGPQFFSQALLLGNLTQITQSN